MPGTSHSLQTPRMALSQCQACRRGQGRAIPDDYKLHILVRVTVLRVLQVGKGADDHDMGNPQGTGRDEWELQGQRNGIWL